ncbi:MAG: hypothetical protein SFV19_07800 [Rhodospirillaceae bacterium]|nr:hypothetical protein [Rhodospirillaceae bacterium]
MTLAMTLAGCGNITLPSLPTSNPAAAAVDDTDLEALISELPPQRLRAGQCGMFLWSRDEQRRLTLFAISTDQDAKMMINNREQFVPRVAGDGRIVQGFAEQQTYAWRNLTFKVAVEFEQRAGLGRGAVIPSGTLRVSRRDGWEAVLPVGGLVACEGQ